MNRDQIVAGLKQHALDCLKILQGFDQARRHFASARKAYQMLTGKDIEGAKDFAIGGPGRKPGIPNRSKMDAGSIASREEKLPFRILRYLLSHANGALMKEMVPDLGSNAATVGTACARLREKGRLSVKKIAKPKGSGGLEYINRYFITKQGKGFLAASLGESAGAKPHKPEKAPRKRGSSADSLSSDQILRALLEMPHGGRVAHIAERLGINGNEAMRTRLGVALPYLRSKHWAKSHKDEAGGVVYSITDAGRTKAEESQASAGESI